jgi:hypothetical protein
MRQSTAHKDLKTGAEEPTMFGAVASQRLVNIENTWCAVLNCNVHKFLAGCYSFYTTLRLARAQKMRVRIQIPCLVTEYVTSRQMSAV